MATRAASIPHLAIYQPTGRLWGPETGLQAVGYDHSASPSAKKASLPRANGLPNRRNCPSPQDVRPGAPLAKFWQVGFLMGLLEEPLLKEAVARRTSLPT